jgi:TonB family protein
MDALTISLELAAIKEQTRRLALWSLIAHAAAAVVFLAAATQPRTEAADDYVITEITWLDPAPEPEPVVIARTETPVEPEPVVVQARPEPVMPDRDGSVAMVQQLTAVNPGERSRELIAAGSLEPAARPRTPATLGSFTPRQARPRQDLGRGATGAATVPAQLTKKQPGIVAAARPTAPRARPETMLAAAEEILPGISLAGEVSGRQLVSYTTPAYPEWAKRDGVEVSVELFFTVLPSGRVKENVLVQRTSGYDDFDRRAKQALATWRFESLSAGTVGEQWGRIEFKYRLRDAG